MKSFDYSENHRYFVTICAKGRKQMFSPTLHDIICAFKSLVTRACRHNGCRFEIWQRSYYEHIIRNEIDYKNIWLYIDNNPARWAEDEYY